MSKPYHHSTLRHHIKINFPLVIPKPRLKRKSTFLKNTVKKELKRAIQVEISINNR